MSSLTATWQPVEMRPSLFRVVEVVSACSSCDDNEVLVLVSYLNIRYDVRLIIVKREIKNTYHGFE